MRSEVYEAARSGDFNSLKKIIQGNGEDLFHQITPKGHNILHVAAQYNQVNLIERLLQCPSGPSLLWQGNSKGDTPLHVAAKVGSYGAVRVFTDLAKSLHWVVENGQVDACKELLRKPNLHEDTALHYAIRGGHDGVAKLLIEVDHQLCTITNAANESPLYLAADQKLPNTTALILDASSLSSSHKGPKGLTALHAAIQGKMRGWRKILEKRPELIKEGDDLGWTPLHYLAWWDNAKVKAVQDLLKHDSSVAYAVDKEGQSALHIAAFHGRVNVINELVRFCPDAWDMINIKGQTALHAAVVGGQAKVVKYILGRPSPTDLINEQDIGGNTALHLAVLHKQYHIIYILAQETKVNRIAKNKDHLTALDIFEAHKEVGWRAAKVKRLLNGSRGMPGSQGRVIEYIKKMLDKQRVEDQHDVSTTTGGNLANRENDDSSKRSIVDLQLLVAVLIATVTFAATFTMPGGYINDGPNQGMATLAGRKFFQLFVMSNTTAFYLSILAIFLQFTTSMSGVSVFVLQHRYIDLAGSCIFFAIISMGLAFACGTYVVLTTTIGLNIFPFVLSGCLLIVLFIDVTPEPELKQSSIKRYVQNLLLDYVIH